MFSKRRVDGKTEFLTVAFPWYFSFLFFSNEIQNIFPEKRTKTYYLIYHLWMTHICTVYLMVFYLAPDLQEGY